ncbi:hypothetical protein EYR41_006544 [Orbilia oligospora]|uniref:RING-type domain-containing protein n=1 Tax=Orbilia oligospora TaxID=2813651 RepID=A0A7C8PSL4_ORBOL|nr:hypothetical protein TWF751_001890 [Orbilia oligospora]TGJ67413.1 hypothetical protein EYR41_006544 [Orbilia oligospora]
MAPRVKSKVSIAKLSTHEIQKKDLEQQISQLAVDLRWADLIENTRRTRKFTAKGTGARARTIGTWKGRTRATSKRLKIRVNPDLLPKPLETYPQEECIACFTCESTIPAYQTVTLKCGHIHCHTCLLINYETVLKFPTGYPPRCCQPLDFESTAFSLSAEQIESLLRAKAQHESTRIIPCAYCGEDLFDAKALISESAAYCLSCNKLTCTTCRKEMHKDVCPESQGILEFQKAAIKAKWNQCPKCNRIIEKSGGCNHISCECGQSFCSKCGEPIRLEDGWGCRCIEKVKPRKITFGESFQPATADSFTPIKGNYKNLLYAHKRATIKKQTRFLELGSSIMAAKQEHEESSRMVRELGDLRAQLARLKRERVTRKLDGDCEKATVETNDETLSVDQSVEEKETMGVVQSPVRKKIHTLPRNKASKS